MFMPFCVPTMHRLLPLAIIVHAVLGDIDVFDVGGAILTQPKALPGNASISALSETMNERSLLEGRQSCLPGYGTCRKSRLESHTLHD